MTAPDGPHKVNSTLQVRLPIRLARQLHIEPGDYYYWRASDDHPGTLEFIPSEIVERRYNAGERLEAASREVAEELPLSEIERGLSRQVGGDDERNPREGSA